jgi:hypothetical protein
MQLRHLSDPIAVTQAGPPTIVAFDQEKGISRFILFCDASPSLSI